MKRASMPTPSNQNPRSLQDLPNLGFRHLEVLQTVARESSYTNAAHELRTSRANIKRICANLVKEVGHEIFIEDEDNQLTLTPFGISLLAQAAPLTRSLLHLGEGIRGIQRKGLILRFAASSDFFKGRSFSYILSRISVMDNYRPCYMRIEPDRFKAALLSSECDIYFGAGISDSKRLELIDLDRLPWSFELGENYEGKQPEKPQDLVEGKWLIESIGEEESAKSLLKELHKAGAKKGRILKATASPADDEILLKPEASWLGLVNPQPDWPTFLFSAAIKKQHPYSELITRLNQASRV